MSTFLTFPDLASAQAANAAATAYVVNQEHGRGTWSDIMTNGTLFGISWADDPCAAVFGPATLSDGTPNPALNLVTEKIDDKGNSDWAQYVPPAPPA